MALASSSTDPSPPFTTPQDPPQILYLEQQLDTAIHNAQKLLILLHLNPTPFHTPSGTRLWIEQRQGINQVRPSLARSLAAGPPSTEATPLRAVRRLASIYLTHTPPRHDAPRHPQHYHVRMHSLQSTHFDQHHVRSDFARLGRILTGTAVGLVLGGGGAR